MNFEVFITGAGTGAGDTTGRSPHVPVTPQQIAASVKEGAIDALVGRAVTVLAGMEARLLGPDAVRDKLRSRQPNRRAAA